MSEQNIVEARAAFDSAKADWNNSGVTSYTLDVGVETIGLIRSEVVNGESVREEIIEDGADDWFADPLPRTVDGLFDELDAKIAFLEDDPSLILPPDDCGYALNARFHPDLGYPTYYDELGPCDDGVGLSATLTPAGAG